MPPSVVLEAFEEAKAGFVAKGMTEEEAHAEANRYCRKKFS